jgi:RNA recognition motif-containing protein
VAGILQRTGETMTRLYIRQLNYSTTKEDLTALFGQYGELRNIHIPLRHDDGLPRGIAFVEYWREEDAERAIKGTNGAELLGWNIKVKFASAPRVPRESRAA